jgi:cytochrome c5
VSSSKILIVAAGLGALSLWACASAQPTSPAAQAAVQTPAPAAASPPAAVAPAPVTTVASPARSGQQILDETCAACHDLGVLSATPHTAEDWPLVLQRMVGYGANLTDAEMKTLETFLIATYTAPH